MFHFLGYLGFIKLTYYDFLQTSDSLFYEMLFSTSLSLAIYYLSNITEVTFMIHGKGHT